MKKTKKHILVTGNLHEIAYKKLQEIPNTRLSKHKTLTKNQLIKVISDVNVLVTRSSSEVDKIVIDNAPELMIIARAGVGISNIDLEYATSKNILVINAPGCNTQSAAELTITLLLAMARKFPQAMKKIKSGGWDRHQFKGIELKNKTIGLIGLGNVGRSVAKIAKGLSMKVNAYDPYLAPKIFDKLGIKHFKDLNQLIKSCQILSVHVPLNKETTAMINLDHLKLLNKNSFVLNTARGGVIVEKDLLTALNKNIIAAAGIDTWCNEPKANMNLISHPNVYCSPHIGAVTEDAQISVGSAIAKQISKALSGHIVDFPVNIPATNTSKTNHFRSHMILGEKLASLAVQICDFAPLKLFYSTPHWCSDQQKKLISSSFQKGYLHPISNQFISYANVLSLFAATGLKIDHYDNSTANQLSVFDKFEKDLKAFDDRNLGLIVVGTKNQILFITGIVYNQAFPRITSINEFSFEASCEGHFLVFKNNDKPGVVGQVGTFLADNNINIDSFYLSSHNQKGKAMAMVKIDKPLDNNLIKQLKKIELIHKVYSVKL